MTPALTNAPLPVRQPNGGQFRRGTALSYEGVLDAAAACLVSSMSWANGHYFARALEYSNQAEAYIELLEVHRCGSVGGFEDGQKGGGSLSLMERWQWLKVKFDEEQSKWSPTI